MDNKLEARIARLEKMLNRKSVKNEARDPIAHKFYEISNKIQDLCVELAKFVTENDCTNITEAFMVLGNVEDNFPPRWAKKYRTFLKRKNGEEEEW